MSKTLVFSLFGLLCILTKLKKVVDITCLEYTLAAADLCLFSNFVDVKLLSALTITFLVH